ncbi:MAG: thiamine biosynthesis lipoprotein [Oleispira sp.]|jgi:thiamine biosynthesis lipoprotein
MGIKVSIRGYWVQTFMYATLLLASLLVGGCSQPLEFHISKISGPTMGTEYHVSWVSKTGDHAASELEKKSIKQQIDQRLSNINKSMSTYDLQSELSLINHSFNPNWQNISVGLYRVLVMAKQVNEQSDGAFDITVGPLVNLWGFGPNKANDLVPELSEINGLLAEVGSDAISLREQGGIFQLRLAAPRYLDLSAIAKGYAVDRLGNLLQERGVDNYLVEVGGEIVAKGFKPQNKHWRIAIEAPDDDGRSVQIIIPLLNMGLATSGDYRNFFELDGKRFSHTIDGRTGYPVDHNLASVSVLHESVALADAWATALTVLGVERGLELAEIYGLAAYFIVRSDKGYQQLSSHQFKILRLD